MKSNIVLILNMFKEGKISEGEAEQLIMGLNHTPVSIPYFIPYDPSKPDITPLHYETTSTNHIEVNQK